MISPGHWFFWLFAAFYWLYIAVEFILDYLNLRHIEQHSHQIPPLFSAAVTSEEYQRSIAYTRTQTHYSWVKMAFDAAVFWILLLTGFFYRLDAWLEPWCPSDALAHQLAYFLILGAILYSLSLPFKLYSQFVIEERFGFNKMTAGTFFLDQFKAISFSLLIGIPLLGLILWLLPTLGQSWWLVAWAVLMAFQWLMAALFPVWFAPLFYKFSPLPEGELKERLQGLAAKVKFKMSGIFTVDGSRRSTHSNAFFAGMGKTRRIVLFDTLVASLSTPEIVAVIAHEMGHSKRLHILKGLLLSSMTTLIYLYILQKCLQWPAFFSAFGVPDPSVQIGFFIFGMASSVFTFPFKPLTQWLSRRNEYEADRFSVEVNRDPDGMVSSLVKLSKDNLSNLTPHPWYSFYHYSHPTTTERAAAIRHLA